MTIDEAIKKLLDKAEEQEYVSQIIVELGREESERDHKAACDACATENRQLAEWLTELLQRREQCAQYEIEQISNLEQYDMLSRDYEILNERYKDAKKVLKAAVEDANAEAESLCAFCKHNDLVDGCPYIENYSECEYVWRYTDEALKLIGENRKK